MAGRLSVFAGSGDLVPHVIAAAQAAGYKVQVLALSPRPELSGVKVVAADVGNPLGIIWSLKTFRTTHVVMAGAISLSDKAREGLARFAAGDKQSNDEPIAVGDAALAGLAKALKTMAGADLLGVHEIAPELVAEEGQIAGPELSEAQRQTAAFALSSARAIGRLDLGQAVVVAGRRIIAAEDVAGTDALLSRVAGYRQQGLVGGGASALVLAKALKPQQPLFADLPAIGPETVANARAAGVDVIAIEARRALLIDRVRLLAAAEAAGIAIVGLALGDD